MTVVTNYIRTVLAGIVTFACASAHPTLASAQRVVLAPYSSTGTGQVLLHNVSTGEAELTSRGTYGPAAATADGRYVLWLQTQGSAPSSLELYDTATRTLTTLPFDFIPHLAHPRATAVYGFSPRVSGAPLTREVTRLDAAGLHRISVCGTDLVRDFDLSADGSTLVIGCSPPALHPVASARLVVVDTTNLQPVRTITLGTRAPEWVVSDRDASLVLVGQFSSGGMDVSTVNTATGQMTPFFSEPPAPNTSTLGLCSIAGRARGSNLVALNCRQLDAAGQIDRTELIDLSTLERRVLTAIPGASVVELSPDATTAIVSVRGAVGLLDVHRDRLTATVPIAASVRAVAYPPLAPRTVTASVAGSDVTLTWTLPPTSPAAVGYLLEAGSVPGASDLARLTLESSTSVTVSAVPKGTYYVRLRATNYTGVSQASPDIVVVVP